MVELAKRVSVAIEDYTRQVNAGGKLYAPAKKRGVNNEGKGVKKRCLIAIK